MNKLAALVAVASCGYTPASPDAAPPTPVVDAAPDLDASRGPPSSAVLLISTPPRARSCDDVSQMTFEVTRDGVCAPVRLEVRGASVDLACPGPTTVACVEVDEPATLTPLETGGYLAHVEGLVRGAVCWVGFASIGAVGGESTAQTLELQPRCP